MKSFLILVISSLLFAAEATTFPDLPGVNSTNVTLQNPSSSLDSLFNSAEGFVNLVFIPFAQLKDLIIPLLKSPNLGETLSSEWQKILEAQAGLIVCLVFGILFIVLVVFGGFILCLCRCCCNRCGGRKKQSKKRSKSKWRWFFTLVLLVSALLILSPGVIVLLTNQWINTVVKDVPQQAYDIIQNVIYFFDALPDQLEFMDKQFTDVADDAINEIRNLRTNIRTNISSGINAVTEPTLAKIDEYVKSVLVLRSLLEQYNNHSLSFGQELADVKDQITTFKSNSFSNIETWAASIDVSALNISVSRIKTPFSSWNLPSVEDHILVEGSDYDACLVLLSNASSNATQTQGIADDVFAGKEINDTISDVQDKLDSIKKVFNESLSIVDAIQKPRQFLADTQNQIKDIFETYSETYDIYRWGAGLGLGISIILISALYILGMTFGQFCNPGLPSPTKRGKISNFGGILLMSAVGLFFILSWMLMIIVTITFIFGGAIERYVCQTSQPPFELLKAVDEQNLVDFSLDSINYTAPSNLLQTVMTSCQQDSGIITALGLDSLFNTTEIETDIKNFKFNISMSSSDFKPFTDVLGLVVCLDTLELELELLELPNTTDLPSASDLATIAGEAKILSTQSTISDFQKFIDETESNATRLSRSVLILEEEYVDLQIKAIDINTTIDNIKKLLDELQREIPQLNTNMSQVIQDVSIQVSDNFKNEIVSNMTAYVTWFSTQANQNLGRCLPVYGAYEDLIEVVCEYFIDTLNGFWFCLGWSLFFMIPGVIFALKLAKFYRRMDETDPDPPKPTSLEIRSINKTPVGGIKLEPINQTNRPRRLLVKRGNNRVGPANL